jgi:polysaccharide pyruvyl transferase WcaK-like protein
LEHMGVTGNGWMVPDLAYSLPDRKLHSESIPSRMVSVVGINPLPFFDGRYWYKSDPRVYENYVKQVAGFATRLISEGYKILMFPTQLRSDPLVIEDVKWCMAGLGMTSVDTHLIEVPVSTEEDLFSAISRTDIVVAARFHGILISFLLHKPVLGIAYQQKTRELMGQMKQAEYVLDINQLDSGLLMERFSSLAAKREIIVKTIQARIPAQRAALEMQYNQVIGPALLSPDSARYIRDSGSFLGR